MRTYQIIKNSNRIIYRRTEWEKHGNTSIPLHYQTQTKFIYIHFYWYTLCIRTQIFSMNTVYNTHVLNYTFAIHLVLFVLNPFFTISFCHKCKLRNLISPLLTISQHFGCSAKTRYDKSREKIYLQIVHCQV